MTQFRRDWLDHINLVHQEMNQLLNHFAGAKPPMVRFSPSVWEPSIDVIETANSLIVIVELPGVRRNDFEISIDRDTFTIQGIRNETSNSNRNRVYHRMEIASGHFKRSIKLPVLIDTNNIKASYTDGLVEVILPKTKTRRAHKLGIDDML